MPLLAACNSSCCKVVALRQQASYDKTLGRCFCVLQCTTSRDRRSNHLIEWFLAAKITARGRTCQTWLCNCSWLHNLDCCVCMKHHVCQIGAGKL